LPGLRTAWELLQGPRYRRVRGRAVFVSSAAASMGLALFAIVPMPLRTVSEGVVWIPEEAQLRTAEEGFVTGILAQEGASVLVGEELVILSNPSLVAAEKRALAALDELQARALATFADNVLENRLLAERIVVAEARASDASRRVRALRLRSPHAGTLHLPNAVDLPGRFLARGQSVGLVVPRDLPVVRGVVEQEQADLVNRHLDGVVLKPSTGPQADVPGLLVRQVPGAHDQLPSMALAVEGGGTVAVIPQKEGAMRAVQPLFHLEVIPADPASLGPVGSRVYIRFDHGWEPLVVRVSRALRQVFMERFGV
ncbi:MAG: hypothetical protein QF724_09835, partial [Planctomycetota bacterium]|nr:hypothetical protein [Planctomycetota bacterium]